MDFEVLEAAVDEGESLAAHQEGVGLLLVEDALHRLPQRHAFFFPDRGRRARSTSASNSACLKWMKLSPPSSVWEPWNIW